MFLIRTVFKTIVTLSRIYVDLLKLLLQAANIFSMGLIAFSFFVEVWPVHMCSKFVFEPQIIDVQSIRVYYVLAVVVSVLNF